MDPLLLSLVHQYLESTKSTLADDFKAKYQPAGSDLTLKEVVSKWKEEQLARGLVYQHLKKSSPLVALEFAKSYQCPQDDISQQLMELIEEDQLIKCLVLQHLREVTPTLATEFRGENNVFLEMIPEKLLLLLLHETSRNNPITAENGSAKDKGYVEDLQKKSDSTSCLFLSSRPKRLGAKVNTFTTEELARIKRAMASKEDINALAKEMGRTLYSVRKKMYNLRVSARSKKGKFSTEEVERIRQAVVQNESYTKVAEEMGRVPSAVRTKMLTVQNNPSLQKARTYSLEEDLAILDAIIPHLKTKDLSSGGFLSLSSLVKLANEFQRNYQAIQLHWFKVLQPCLLQHYCGTSGLRIERMLTQLVAQQYKDHLGIDWSEVLKKHKEFTGHTAGSLGRVFTKCRSLAKRKYNREVSLLEVAEYAAVAYQPGKEKRDSVSKVAHKEKIIGYFNKKVKELGIKIVV